jgi:hypothetical protein
MLSPVAFGSRGSSMQSHRPVPIESRALGTLSYIRASIDAAGSLAVPGLAGIVMGAIGIAATVLASLPPLAPRWLVVWIVAALTAGALGGALMARQATRNGGLLFAPFRKFLLCLCPALLAGAVVTLLLWQSDLERYIPGTWLLLYGCAVIAASTATVSRNLRLIAIMGGIFFLLGCAAYLVPASAHNLLLGTGFGALHLVFGVLIGRVNHGD